MSRLITFLVIVAVIIGGFAYYMDWLNFDYQKDESNGKVKVQAELDKNKAKKDVDETVKTTKEKDQEAS